MAGWAVSSCRWVLKAPLRRSGWSSPLTFVGLPFVVRTLQPVLENLDRSLEEAAATLGASRWRTVVQIIGPTLLPTVITGFASAFARAMGEYGSIVFISGNLPFKTEIAPYLIVMRLGRVRLHRGDGVWPSCCCHFVSSSSPASTGSSPGPAISTSSYGWSTQNQAGARARTSQRGSEESRCRQVALDRRRAGFRAGLPALALGERLRASPEQGIGRLLAFPSRDPDALSAIRLTLTVAAISVPLNLVFGVAAAWAIAKFDVSRQGLADYVDRLALCHFARSFPGSSSSSSSGCKGSLALGWMTHDVKIIFALPGIVLATLFVTFPFVARELIPVMQATGTEQEQAALTLGASGWQAFWYVTLPSVRWGLLYGVILCNARAMGEFGAVSVVSGHIAGLTETMPLRVEKLYNEYNATAAFALASLLAVLALLTLGVKTFLEWKQRARPGAGAAKHAWNWRQCSSRQYPTGSPIKPELLDGRRARA